MMLIFLFIFKWLPNLYASESFPEGHDIFKNHSSVLLRTEEWYFIDHSYTPLVKWKVTSEEI